MSHILLTHSCNAQFDLIETISHFDDHTLDIVSTIALYLSSRLSRLVLNNFIRSRLYILNDCFNVANSAQENVLIIQDGIDLMSLK